MALINIRFFSIGVLALGSEACSSKYESWRLDEPVAAAECEDVQPNFSFQTRRDRQQQAMLRMIKSYVSSTSRFSDLGSVLDDAKVALSVSLPFANETPFTQWNGTTTKTTEEKEEAAAMLRIVRAYVSSKSKTTDSEQMVNDINLVFNETLEDIYEDKAAKPGKESTTDYFADKHIQGTMDVISDSDCMSREFDVTEDDYDVEEAKTVFKKCKLLVLRNVFAVDLMEEFTKNFTKFINGINTGRVSRMGKSTNGESVFWQRLNHGKWEILLPRRLAHVDLHAKKTVIDILSDPDILGDEMALHSSGAIFSESGSNYQSWHVDNPYLFNDDASFERSGVAGHDLPSYAVGTLTPMLNMTYLHGPTEFCMGSSHLSGLTSKIPKVKDASLVGPSSVYMEYKEALQTYDACPPRFWRSPLVKFGDLVLFDYQLTHRAGMNLSPDLRALFYMTYSRRWFKDSSFQVEKGKDIDTIGDLKSELKKLDPSSDDDDSDDDDSLEEGTRQISLARGREVIDSSDDSSDDNDIDDVIGEPKKEKILLSFILRSARLAVPDYDYDGDGTLSAGKESLVKLEDMNWFDSEMNNPKRSEHFEFESEKFLVSNTNIQIDDIAIYADEEKVGDFKCGESIRLTAKPGQNIEIRSADGFVYKSWPILPGTTPRQLVADMNTIKVPET